MTRPDLVGRKLLRVNLSDLAAKGATPLGYLMTISTPRDTPEAWFVGFAAGLADDQRDYGVALSAATRRRRPGRLPCRSPPSAMWPPGQAVHRAGASAGDGIWVTGTIGDGALGLAVARGRLADPAGHLLSRYRLPQPRVGLPIAGLASAGMDVSDGLVQDLGHICRASNVGAEIEAGLVPSFGPARAAGPDWLTTCLTGGDDYELLLAVPPARESRAARRGQAADIAVTRIGGFVSGAPRVIVRGADGSPMALATGGWSHF